MFLMSDYKETRKKVSKWLSNTNRKEIRKTARPNKYPWNFWSAKWSTGWAVLALRLGLKPNHVSYAWFYLGIISTFFLWTGEVYGAITFIVLYILTWHLDFVDGDMGRIVSKVAPKYKQNVAAAWLDKFAYSTHKSLVLLGLGVWAFRITSNPLYLGLGFATSYLLILDNLMKVRVVEMLAGKKKYEFLESKIEYVSKGKFVNDYLKPFIRPEPVSIVTLALIFGFVPELMFFYTLLYSVFIIKSFRDISRYLSNIYR